MTNEKILRLEKLAMRFWREVEAPSDDDMETLFHILLHSNLPALEAYLKNSGISTED
jgi:hypothetical protein